MAEFTDDDAKRAGTIVEGLLREERRPETLEKGLSVVDLESDSNQFLAELELAKYFEFNLPAMSIGDGPPIPVSLQSHLTSPFALQIGRWFPHRHRGPLEPFWYEYGRAISRALRESERWRGDEPTLSPDAARESFSNGATAFIATRIAGIRSLKGGAPPPGSPPISLNMPQYIGGPPALVSGCHFTVSTNSPGLSAYWAGAYYISPNYLASPTTPAKGVLQAGTYVFGVDGGAYGNVVQWDTKKVCSLPGMPSVHLHY